MELERERIGVGGNSCGRSAPIWKGYRPLREMADHKRHGHVLPAAAQPLQIPRDLFGSFGLSWMDITAPVGLGGIWLAYFLIQLGKRPLMPPGDPQLEEALEHGRE